MDTLVRILDDEHFEINLSEPKVGLYDPIVPTCVRACVHEQRLRA